MIPIPVGVLFKSFFKEVMDFKGGFFFSCSRINFEFLRGFFFMLLKEKLKN